MDGGEDRRCPECGAPLDGRASCEELFHEALLMEWVDPPATAAAHHLLVGTYMLQHPARFTPEGRAVYPDLIATVVDERLTAEQARERLRGRFDQRDRDWKLTAKEPAPPVLREWPVTIAGVLDGPPAELPARVWRWAESSREELREG